MWNPRQVTTALIFGVSFSISEVVVAEVSPSARSARSEALAVGIVKIADSPGCVPKCNAERATCIVRANSTAMEREEGKFSKAKKEELHKKDRLDCETANTQCLSACAK